MDSNPPPPLFTFLIFLQSLGASCCLFFLVLSRLVLLRSLFLSSTPWFTIYFGGNTLSRTQWKRIYQFLFQVHFYPFLSQNKNCLWNQHTMFCGKKENLLLPSLCWKLKSARPLCSSA